MTDTYRLRHDDVTRFAAAVDTDTVIEIGDLVYFDSNELKPAIMLGDQASEQANQALLAASFAGVAMQASPAGMTDPVRVAADGVFQFNCPSGTWEIGDLVGASENSGGDGLLAQQVEPVSRPENAIGYVAQREAGAVTTVKVRLLSRVASPLQFLRLEQRQQSSVATMTEHITLTADDARIQVLDPDDVSGRSITLPPEAASAGLDFLIHNTADGDESLVIKNDAAGTICVIGQNETGYLYCDGTTWRGMRGSNN